jgi:hypothetical protein
MLLHVRHVLLLRVNCEKGKVPAVTMETEKDEERGRGGGTGKIEPTVF